MCNFRIVMIKVKYFLKIDNYDQFRVKKNIYNIRVYKFNLN